MPSPSTTPTISCTGQMLTWATLSMYLEEKLSNYKIARLCFLGIQQLCSHSEPCIPGCRVFYAARMILNFYCLSCIHTAYQLTIPLSLHLQGESCSLSGPGWPEGFLTSLLFLPPGSLIWTATTDTQCMTGLCLTPSLSPSLKTPFSGRIGIRGRSKRGTSTMGQIGQCWRTPRTGPSTSTCTIRTGSRSVSRW